MLRRALLAAALLGLMITAAACDGSKSAGLSVSVPAGGSPVVKYVASPTEKPGADEFYAMDLLIGPADGQALDAEIAGSGGDGVVFFGPFKSVPASFSNVYNRKKEAFVGYRIVGHDTDAKFIRSGETIEVNLVGDHNDPIRWPTLAPKAKVSAAISIRKKDSNFSFVRFASPVSSVTFDVPK